MVTVGVHQKEVQDFRRHIHTNDTVITPNSKPCYSLIPSLCGFLTCLLTHVLERLPERFFTIFLVQSLDDSICYHSKRLYGGKNNDGDGNNIALPFDYFDRVRRPNPII